MKVILRDPPLFVLLLAIAFDLPVRRSEGSAGNHGWMSQQLNKFIEWRDSLARRT